MGVVFGIGKVIVFCFVEVGVVFELVDIDELGFKGVKKEVEEFGVEVNIYCVDILCKVEIDVFWKVFEGREFNIFVNNVGVYWFKDFIEVNEDFYERVMNINFYFVFWMC